MLRGNACGARDCDAERSAAALETGGGRRKGGIAERGGRLVVQSLAPVGGNGADVAEAQERCILHQDCGPERDTGDNLRRSGGFSGTFIGTANSRP